MWVGTDRLQFQTKIQFNINYEKYIVLFSSIFTQYKFVNEEIFMTVIQKYKLNPANVRKITKKLYKTTF